MTDSRRLRLNPQHKDRLKRLVECWTLEEARVVIPDYRTDVNQVVDNGKNTICLLTKTYMECLLSCTIKLV
jgi:hypothetical protein